MLRRVREKLRGWWWTAARRWGTAAARMGLTMAHAVRVLPARRRVKGGEPESFLVVNLTPHLGDTIMMMPMLEELRETFPGARIECAVEASAAPLLERMSAVDRVYGLRLGTSPPLTERLTLERLGRIFVEYGRWMRGARPTVAICPRWGNDLFRSQWVAALSTAGRRIGFAADVDVPRNYAAPYRDRLLTDAVRGGGGMHEPERFRFLVRAAGLASGGDGQRSREVVGSLAEMAGEADWARLSERLGIARDRRFAVIAPAASQPRKVWPLDRWTEVAERMRAWGLEVVVLSGGSDAWMARAVHERDGRRSTLVAGATSLPESVTLLGRAALFLGNDSGPGHVAGALGVPSVVLFSAALGVDGDDPFSPVRNGPMGPRVRCLQPRRAAAPCEGSCAGAEAHCILGIGVEEVVSAAESLLVAGGVLGGGIARRERVGA